MDCCENKKAPPCDICRKKERGDGEQKKLANRLKRIEGQIRGIIQMVEDSAYCPDILIQVSAVQAALSSFSKELLAEHIRSCVTEDIRAGREGTPEELAALVARLMK